MQSIFAEAILIGVAVVLAIAVVGYMITFTHSTVRSNPLRMLSIGEDSNLVICGEGSNWSAVLYFPFRERGTAPIKLYQVELEGIGSFHLRYYLIAEQAPSLDTVCSLAPSESEGVLLRPGDQGYLVIFVPSSIYVPSGVQYVNVILYSTSGEIYLTLPLVYS